MAKLFKAIIMISILIQAGCTLTAYLRSDQAVMDPFDKNASIYVTSHASMTVEEANFMVLVQEGIIKSGLKIEKNLGNADYILSFMLAEPALLGQSLRYEPVVPMSSFSQEWPVYYFPVSYVYSYSGFKISMAIYEKANFLAASRIPLWDSTLTVIREAYPKHGEQLIAIMLEHVGQRFEGRVKISQ